MASVASEGLLGNECETLASHVVLCMTGGAAADAPHPRSEIITDISDDCR